MKYDPCVTADVIVHLVLLHGFIVAVALLKLDQTMLLTYISPTKALCKETLRGTKSSTSSTTLCPTIIYSI